jgi:hypothetical protein
MGIIENYQFSWVMNSVELALSDLGIRKFDGTANRVYLEGVTNAK